MKRKVWVLGGQGMMGEALKHLVPAQAEFHFLGRPDFSLGNRLGDIGVRSGDAIIDLIPPPFPRQFPDLKQNDYHEQFTRPHQDLIQEAGGLNLAKFVFLSSGGAIYGNSDSVHSEKDELNPVSYYGESKKILEESLGKSPLSYVILRPSNIFNSLKDSNRQTGIIGIYLQRFLKKEAVEVFGSLDISKDYVASSDVAHAILLALDYPSTRTFNIGSGETTSIGDIIGRFEKSMGHKVPVHIKPFIANDVRKFALDVSAAKRELGFEAKIRLLDWI